MSDDYSWLTVYECPNKRRLGAIVDGGYVFAELSGVYDCYISAGVSNEESFSRDFIKMYNMNEYNSFAFDGTIKGYPYEYTKNITFIQQLLQRTSYNSKVLKPKLVYILHNIHQL